MKRIQRQRTKGWRMPEGAIYVGRPSRWGNLHRIGDEYLFVDELWIRSPWDRGDRTLVNQADLVKAYRQDCGLMEPQEIEEYVGPLRGHNLACWCPLDQPCHADVLLDLAFADGNPLPCVRPDTPCGHPLAARAIRSSTAGLRTVCWACEVEAA